MRLLANEGIGECASSVAGEDARCAERGQRGRGLEDFEAREFPRAGGVLQEVEDRTCHGFDIHWLDDDSLRTSLSELVNFLCRRASGERENPDPRVAVVGLHHPDGPARCLPVHPRHVTVHENEVDGVVLLRDEIEGLFPVFREDHFEPRALENHARHLLIHHLVIHHQHTQRRRRRRHVNPLGRDRLARRALRLDSYSGSGRLVHRTEGLRLVPLPLHRAAE
mmetsp:Transcript_31732/g.72663  ORF Transcript_31732/g.72663 Transcript_31732/m.72663 type:complete len:223 (+) Transcript_31732:29-697(+)